MLELLVAVAGGALTVAGLAWRFRFRRTGIPAVRAVLSDPDPKVRAAALDHIDASLDTYAPELVNLARRERAPEVSDALVRLVDRFGDLDQALWDSPELEELRALTRASVDRSFRTDQQLEWAPGVSAQLLVQLEQALGEQVTWLRALTPSGAFELKTT